MKIMTTVIRSEGRSLGCRVLGVSCIIFFYFILLPINLLWAIEPEYLHSQNKIPSTLSEVESGVISLDQELEQIGPKQAPLLYDLFEKLGSDPFYRDATLNLNFRSYYFHREVEDSNNPTAGTVGGNVDLQSGWWRDFLSLHLTGYTSQKVYGPLAGDGTFLLADQQKSFSVLGQVNAKLKYEDLEARIYRQALNIPYLNMDDGRMAPNTFEAYMGIWQPTKKWKVFGGQTERMKPKNGSSFVPMSQVAGAQGVSKGLSTAGLFYQFDDQNDIGLVNHAGWDTFNTLYGACDVTLKILGVRDVKLSLQFTDQRSIGEEQVGEFKTAHYGAQIQKELSHFILSGAFTTVDRDADIRSPWGGQSIYNSSMLADFNRAGEASYGVGITHDLGSIGIEDVKVSGKFVVGDTPNSGSAATPDQHEYDLEAEWSPQSGWLRDFSFRARFGWLAQEKDLAGRQTRDTRIIVNRTLAVF